VLKKVQLLYIFFFVLAICTGVYFVFATSQTVTLTAVVPGSISVVENNSSAPTLGWSYRTETANNEVTKTPEQGSLLRPFGAPSFLTRFSVMIYWYKRDNPPAEVDLNSDGRVNIIDFSILAYSANISL
jgi:hypothetical protein